MSTACRRGSGTRGSRRADGDENLEGGGRRTLILMSRWSGTLSSLHHQITHDHRLSAVDSKSPGIGSTAKSMSASQLLCLALFNEPRMLRVKENGGESVPGGRKRRKSQLRPQTPSTTAGESSSAASASGMSSGSEARTNIQSPSRKRGGTRLRGV